MYGNDVVDYRDPRIVDEVIARAERHPLGIDFLLGGELGCVAISLGTHAFAVEAAREWLRATGKGSERDH